MLYKIEHIKKYIVESRSVLETDSTDDAVSYLMKFYWISDKRNRDDLYDLLRYIKSKIVFEHNNYQIIINKNQ